MERREALAAESRQWSGSGTVKSGFDGGCAPNSKKLLEIFMADNIQDAISAFSEKLKKISGFSEAVLKKNVSEDKILEEKIRHSAQVLRANVANTYRIYKSPFAALGKNSSRAASIEADEQALFEAYSLFEGAMELNKRAGEKNGGTHISKVEISSPLAQKSCYTSGGQFIWLFLWLYFEKNCREYFPYFSEREKGWELCFKSPANFLFEGREKEVFEIVKSEFYS